MVAIQKVLSSWHKLIQNNEVKTVHGQLELEITNKKWPAEQENQMANYCLISTNMKAYELLKSNIKESLDAQQIFLMSDFCCRIISETWQCDSTKFLGSIHVICKYFLASNKIYEALVIGQYSMEYVDKCNEPGSSEDKNPIVAEILLIYLRYLHKMSVNDWETMLDIWKFVTSPLGLRVKSSNFSSIFLCFEYLCSKTNSTEYLHSSLLTMLYLSELPFVDLTDKDINTFINVCELLIRYSKGDQMKNTISNIIRYVERIKPSYNSNQIVTLQFCCDLLHFSICSCDPSACSIFVDKCSKGLNALLSITSTLRDRAVNFVQVVMIQTQNLWIDEKNFFYRKCLPNLFAFLIKLSETAKLTEMNQNNTNERKYTIPRLAFAITHRVQDLNDVELAKIYPYVKKFLSVLLEVYNIDCDANNTQKIQLYNNIGAHSFNVCYVYMNVKLYSECEELSLLVNQKFAAITYDLMQNSTLPSFIEKLAVCLYQSGKYENALKLMCTWALKLPNSRSIFMNRFGSFKAKIFHGNQDCRVTLVNKSCWDLIKADQRNNPSLWDKINISDRDIMALLKLELKQCLANQIYSVDLIEKIINQGLQRNDIAKTELYVLGGLIFTQSNEFLNNAAKLLPFVEKFIDELNQKMIKKISEEHLIRYSTILGSLQYVKFRIKLLNARCENEREVTLTKSIKPMPSEPGMEQETRDDSDVIHKYLTYKSQQEFIHYLDTAVSWWSRAIIEVTDKKDPKLREKHSKIWEEMNIPSLIQETALMYRLYCVESKEIQAWKLLYSLAVIREDDETIVYAFSNLLSLNVPVDPEWETKVLEKLRNVEKITQIRYRLETILKLFINGHGLEGTAILSQISEEDVNSSALLAAKYHFLVSQYTLAGFFKITDYPMSTAIRAFYLLVPYIKTNSWRNLSEACEIQSLLLDVTLFILRFHVAAFQTTFIRAYLDKAVYLIKKLGLPLRICQILTISCRVGVITCKTEDIHVKLDVLKSVLKFNEDADEENNDKLLPVKSAVTLSPPELHPNTDVRFVSNFNNNYASPILESGLKYDKPEFVDHKLPCECVVCGDVLYQQISCEVMSLFGSYFWLMENNHHGLALRHFKDSLEMSNQLRNRWENVDRTKYDGFAKTQIITKMCLGDFWASSGEFEKARNLNKEARREYENLIIPEEALRAQLYDQYLALEHIKLSAGLSKKRVVRQKLALGTTVPKTPACKTTVTVFEDDEETSRVSEMIKNMAITPLPRNSRRLLFKNDDDEFTKSTASNRMARIRNKKEESAPAEIVMKTPSSVRCNSRKKTKDEATSSVAFNYDDDNFCKPTGSSRIARVKNKKEYCTPPDIVIQTPSAVQSASKKIINNNASSSVTLKNEDDFCKPAARIRNKKTQSTSSDTAQTPSCSIGSRKKLGSKVSSSDMFKIDNDLLTAVSVSATYSRTAKIKNKKDESVPLDIVIRTPSSRSRSRKILEDEVTPSVAKNDEILEDEAASSVVKNINDKPNPANRTTRNRNKQEASNSLDIIKRIKRIPSSQRDRFKKILQEGVSSSTESSPHLTIRKN